MVGSENFEKFMQDSAKGKLSKILLTLPSKFLLLTNQKL